MLIWLVALAGIDAVTVAESETDKAAYEKCLKTVPTKSGTTLEAFLDATSACSKAATARRQAEEAKLPPDVPTNLTAKRLADHEAYEFAVVNASENSTALDRCAQAGLTAQAYLAAGMSRAYDEWKGRENYECQNYQRSITRLGK